MMNNEIENVIKRFRVSISQEAKKVKLTKQALENTNTQQILASEDEQDKLERTLKEVFFKAKNEVANDIINKFCNEKDEHGRTALMYALRYNASNETIKLLIERGADVNAKDKNECTVLMYALRYNASNETIKLLTDRAKYVNAGKIPRSENIPLEQGHHKKSRNM